MKKITSGKMFDEFISDGTAILDFWAEWCGPCKMLAPVLEELETEHPEIKFGKVNVDEEVELCYNFKIVSIPTLIVFDCGNQVNKIVGYRTKEELEELLFKK